MKDDPSYFDMSRFDISRFPGRYFPLAVKIVEYLAEKDFSIYDPKELDWEKLREEVYQIIKNMGLETIRQAITPDCTDVFNWEELKTWAETRLQDELEMLRRKPSEPGGI
ncbi:MAG: hypothetical protein FWD01_04945 [Defluviitaleaceae bacterium]|nr:hypothetical protein [Defluviitaleaceae bacterium]